MSENPAPRILDAGDSCLVVEFGTAVDRELNAKVQALKASVSQKPAAGIVELVPTYRSLAVYYDPNRMDRETLKNLLEERSAGLGAHGTDGGRVVAIPVCYGGTYGPDLDNVCTHTKLPPEEVLARHTGRDTYCFMLGFTPGFAYLGGMDETLATPRLENPRAVIPAGSVGIAGKQTGISPSDSPGGWQRIGQTPRLLVAPLRKPPTLIEAGDWVRFEAVDEAGFLAIKAAAKAGTYTLKTWSRKEGE